MCEMTRNTKSDISFEDLRLGVGDLIRRRRSEILKGISGEFRACQLSAVLGQSGSGKSSLLNVLSGFTKKCVSGSIKINKKSDEQAIRKRSKYIMQDYTLHGFITVQEAMQFSAKLQLTGFDKKSRLAKITATLDKLTLTAKASTYCGDLSGGEQKRLMIALELIDDPSILFLDEPTTGLDSSSSTQCIQLLKTLANEGRTVICTIHTPSAIIFKMFDQIYALADGHCIYSGSSANLVPFLRELNLICPETYNPADFLIEVANEDYGPQNSRLREKIENGRCSLYRDEEIDCHQFVIENRKAQIKSSSSSLSTQFRCLLHKNFLISSRDKTLSLMRLAIHLAIGTFIGIMYYGIGDDASNIFNIYKFLFFNIFILMFTAFSSLQTSFPLDLPIIRRENFNQWYSASAYYLALTVADIPMIVITNLLYIVITYTMTNQPMEAHRFAAYCTVILVVSFAAQGLGLIAGSIMNVKFTLILGSFFICPFVLFSNFFVHMKDTDAFWHWIFEVSFIRHGLEGSMQAVFGFDREKMNCEADYCHYRWPNKFLESLGIAESLTSALTKLATFALISRVIAFAIMWLRLRH